ncbi:MAG: hypothetical protein WD154_01695 [Nitrosopumilaceae archaeon]
MGNNLGFRAWFYFRNGWSIYFAFIFAAVNTMVVTYYLAIEDLPALKEIFPSFLLYLIVISSIGVPLLIFVGYIHFKRTAAYKAEADIYYESNPFALRTLNNTEMLIKLNLKLINNLIKLANNEKLTNDELEEVSILQKEYENLINERTYKNKKDLEFFKKLQNKKSNS